MEDAGAEQPSGSMRFVIAKGWAANYKGDYMPEGTKQ